MEFKKGSWYHCKCSLLECYIKLGEMRGNKFVYALEPNSHFHKGKNDETFEDDGCKECSFINRKEITEVSEAEVMAVVV